MTSPLFTGTRIADLALPNRIVMAPMTRVRAGAEGLATASMAAYYAQRATAEHDTAVWYAGGDTGYLTFPPHQH